MLVFCSFPLHGSVRLLVRSVGFRVSSLLALFFFELVPSGVHTRCPYFVSPLLELVYLLYGFCGSQGSASRFKDL